MQNKIHFTNFDRLVAMLNLEDVLILQQSLINLTDDTFDETLSTLVQSTIDAHEIAFEIHNAALARISTAPLYARLVSELTGDIRKALFFVVPPRLMSIPFLEACIDSKLINEADILSELENSYLSPDLTEEIAIANLKLIGRPIRDSAPLIFAKYMSLIGDKEAMKTFLSNDDDDEDIADILENDDPKKLSKMIYKCRSCLDLAIKHNSRQCYQFLIDNGEQPTDSTYLTAITYGRFDIIPDNYHDDRAVETAVRSFRDSTIEWLLGHAHASTESAIKAAAEVGNITALKLFDAKSSPALIDAAVARGSLATLLCFGMPDVLHRACELGHTHIVMCQTIAPDCLVSAVKSLKLPLVTFLITLPAVDINAKDGTGNTALHYAVRSGYVDMVMALVHSQDIDVNATNDDGQTPLHVAAQFDHAEAIEILLDQPGIKRMALDKERRTPLMIAKANNHYESTELLKDSQNETDGNAKLTEFFKFKS